MQSINGVVPRVREVGSYRPRSPLEAIFLFIFFSSKKDKGQQNKVSYINKFKSQQEENAYIK